MTAVESVPDIHRAAGEEYGGPVSGSCGIHSGDAHAHEEALREASFLRLLAKRRREAGDEDGARVAEQRAEEISEGR